MSDVNSIGDINREIGYRCNSLGLRNDCPSDGLFMAKIAIIADFPGEREKTTKMPLSGNGGKMLWDLLRPHGVSRRSVYISNAIKRQVPPKAAGDDNDKVSPHERDHYAQVLQWELQQLPNLQYIVVLGDYALEAVTGLRGIADHRGSVYDTTIRSLSTNTSRECKVIAMMNPSDVVRQPKWEIMLKFDAGRLADVISGKFKPHNIIAHINPTFKHSIDWIRSLRYGRRPVSFDIETIGGETACWGLANNAHEGFCINLRDKERNIFSVAEETTLRLELQAMASDPNVQWVMQNGMFDKSWCAYKDRLMFEQPAYFDTMLAHHTLYPGLPHGLGFLTSQYTTHPFYKDEGKAWKEGGDIDTFWEYNVKDACITFAAYEAMREELQSQGLWDFFVSHVMRLQNHLVNMTVGGIKADEELKQTIARETTEEVARLKAKFQELAREATGDQDLVVNPASPKQLANLYFQRLRLQGRGTATNVKNRARMRAHPRTPPLAREMLDVQDKWAKEAKFLGTYAEMAIDEDGRVRCEYKQTGVASAPGRLSSSQVMWGSGGNLQNQPERAHKMYIADEGYEFNYFDLSQAEARVVGVHYDIQVWIDQFEQARIDGIYDAHRALASEMFNLPYDEVPKEDWIDGEMTIRYKAKRCRHGLNYRMMADKLAETLGISFGEAQELWNIYHATNPELQVGWAAVIKRVEKDRALYNAYGRRWKLLERYDEEALKSVIAFYPQSTIGDKVSRCIYLCENDPDWPVGLARMGLNIHDALIALNHQSVGDDVRRIMKKHAEEPIPVSSIHTGKVTQLIVPADLKKSMAGEDGIHRWSTLKKVKLAA